MKKVRVIVFIISLILATGLGLFELSKSRTFQLFGELVHRVTTDEKVIALTFDDGPTAYTEEVLKKLAEKEVKATFFLIGEALEKHQDIGKAIADAGHDIGNHSYSHQRFLLKTQSFIAEEIQKTNALIRETGFDGEIYFRPPNGKKLIGLPWYLSQNNIKTIMWDIEPDTYAKSSTEENIGSDVNSDKVTDIANGSQNAEFLVEHTLSRAKPGSIVLLHPFCAQCGGDREAIGKIIDALHAQGYRFVTVSELLKLQ